FQRSDIGLLNRLKPNSLPDACARGVENAARPVDLLAARLRALVSRVRHANNELLFPRCLERLGQIEAKRIVTARVLAELLPVEPDGCLPIDCAEMQQH